MSRRKKLSRTECSHYCNKELKAQYEWLKEVDKVIGLDLGIKEFCITSDKDRYENLKTLRKYEKLMIKLQRQLAYKKKAAVIIIK